jgi:hypothetical protein
MENFDNHPLLLLSVILIICNFSEHKVLRLPVERAKVLKHVGVLTKYY